MDDITEDLSDTTTVDDDDTYVGHHSGGNELIRLPLEERLAILVYILILHFAISITTGLYCCLMRCLKRDEGCTRKTIVAECLLMSSGLFMFPVLCLINLGDNSLKKFRLRRSVHASGENRQYKLRTARKLYVKYWDSSSKAENLCPTCQCDFQHAELSVSSTGVQDSGCKVMVMTKGSHRKTTARDLDTCVTECGHCFHFRCLRLCLERVQLCPVCRSGVDLARCYVVPVDLTVTSQQEAREGTENTSSKGDGCVSVDMELCDVRHM